MTVVIEHPFSSTIVTYMPVAATPEDADTTSAAQRLRQAVHALTAPMGWTTRQGLRNVPATRPIVIDVKSQPGSVTFYLARPDDYPKARSELYVAACRFFADIGIPELSASSSQIDELIREIPVSAEPVPRVSRRPPARRAKPATRRPVPQQPTQNTAAITARSSARSSTPSPSASADKGTLTGPSGKDLMDNLMAERESATGKRRR